MNGPEHYPFSVRPLPYPSGALAPMLDGRTVRIHHDGHYASYVQKLNEILKSYPQYQKLPLELKEMPEEFSITNYILKASHLPDAQLPAHHLKK